MCECVALNHLIFAHHNGGVCVSAFTCKKNQKKTFPLVPTPPFTTRVTSTTFPAKVNSSCVDGKPIQ